MRYEVAVTGTPSRPGTEGPAELTATFQVDALWPAAAETAAQQLFLARAAREPAAGDGFAVTACETRGADAAPARS